MAGNTAHSLEVPAAPIREKLMNLERHMPGRQNSLYEFGRAIASKINGSEYVSFPMLNTSAVGAASDLAFSESVARTLRGHVPDILRVVCPELSAAANSAYNHHSGL
jgi:hypothetical protein